MIQLKTICSAQGRGYMKIKRDLLNDFYNGLDERSREALDCAVSKVVETKKKGGKVAAVVTGSGPNLYADSIPVIGDIGMIWPVFAVKIANELGIKLDFISYKQETEEGR